MRTTSPWLNAIFTPLNLTMLLAIAVSSLLAAWWFLIVGIVFWLIMVATIATHPALKMDNTLKQRQPLPSRFQIPFNRIVRIQLNLYNSMASAPAATKRMMQPVQDTMDELIENVYRVCLRLMPLENYRATSQNISDLQMEIENLRMKIEKTEDPLIKAEYEEALQSISRRVQKQHLVNTHLERMDTQLLSLANDLSAILAETMRVQSLKPELAQPIIPELQRKVQKEIQDLKQFEELVSAI